MYTRLIPIAILVISVIAGAPNTVSAGKPAAGGGTASDPRTGIDISWPQCGKVLPSGQSYAIVGLNDGTANTTNRCIVDQLKWTQASTLGNNPNQPKLQIYVNTGNPFDDAAAYNVTTWPTDNVDSRGNNSLTTTDPAYANPYGECKVSSDPAAYRGYDNSLACSWQYGWNRAVEDVYDRFAPSATAAGISSTANDYKWWLDVETMNSWQFNKTAAAYARNTATLEGMKQAFAAAGITRVGIYSTSYQWGQIVGNTLSIPTADAPATGANLKGLQSWLAGAANAKDAKTRCTTLKGLTGGPVVLNQYISRNLDYNYSCI